MPRATSSPTCRHELRTPLTAIIGYSELMADDVTGETEAERAKFLGVVVANARHLEELIDGILDLSKVEAGKMEFHPELVHVRELIDDVVTALHVPVEKKQIELITDVADEVRSVVTDPVRLKQVASNYLSNALKFTPERGRIQVRVTPEAGDSFRIAVADNGIGIAPEDQKKLFRDFQQVDQTAQKEHPGTGLGLSLVKRIVEIQGGQVGVHSELGKGSEFYAVMPRNSRKVDFHQAAAQRRERQRQWQRERQRQGRPDNARPGEMMEPILVVEDNESIRELIQIVLRGAGHEVQSVGDAEAALEIARTDHPRLIL